VISVDSEKREQVGSFGQKGREWRPAGDPVVVASHDFPDKDGGHAIPYGVYDEDANAGFVNVGTDGNTAALAVESPLVEPRREGRLPGATRLLVTCDAGGSNSHSGRAWKTGLSELAQETGLEITVCHFPPGTVTTQAGLTVTAVLDTSPCPTGLHVSDAQMKDLEDRALTRRHRHRPAGAGRRRRRAGDPLGRRPRAAPPRRHPQDRRHPRSPPLLTPRGADTPPNGT
jgi:hypothetical protein